MTSYWVVVFLGATLCIGSYSFSVSSSSSSLDVSQLMLTVNVSLVGDELQLNPRSKDYFRSAAYYYRKLNVVLPWRIQFLYQLVDCSGANWPITIGDGFSFIIQNEGFNFSGESGGNLGYCRFNCSESYAVLFDFLQPSVDKDGAVRLANSSVLQNPLVQGVSPIKGYNWSQIDGRRCGVMFDTIVDYNGTHLSLYMESFTPWFTYPLNFSRITNDSTAFIGWTSGSGTSIINVGISKINWYSHEKPPLFLRSKICTSSSIVTPFNISQISPLPLPPPPPPPTSLQNFIYLNDTAKIAYFKDKIDVVSPWDISFTFSFGGCLLPNQISFIIQDDGPILLNSIKSPKNFIAIIIYFNTTITNITLLKGLSQERIHLGALPSICNQTSTPVNVNYNKTQLQVTIGIESLSTNLSIQTTLTMPANCLAYIGWLLDASPETFMIYNITLQRTVQSCSTVYDLSPYYNKKTSFDVFERVTIYQLPSYITNINLVKGQLSILGNFNYKEIVVFNDLSSSITVNGRADFSNSTIIINLQNQPIQEGITYVLITAIDLTSPPNIQVQGNNCVSYITSSSKMELSLSFHIECISEYIPIMIGAILGGCAVIGIIAGVLWYKRHVKNVLARLDALNVDLKNPQHISI